jgi:hypothetical protein
MKINDLKPLAGISDEEVFYKGTRFRQYVIGLNVKDPEDDYYEYMLAEIPGEPNRMLLTCVEGYKSGSHLALVKKDKNEHHVTGEAMKFSMGTENTYVMPSPFVV